MVLDANVLVRLVVPGDYSEQAHALWDWLATGAERCTVPFFCPTEVISSLRQLGCGGHLLPTAEEKAVDQFIATIEPGLTLVGSPALLRVAWEIARDLNERHTYDSVYLAIAQAYNTEFWTADRQLLRRLNGCIAQARFLGDYPLPAQPP